MFWQAIHDGMRRHGAAAAIVEAGETTTWDQLAATTDEIAGQLLPANNQLIGIAATNVSRQIAALAAVQQQGLTPVLLPEFIAGERQNFCHETNHVGAIINDDEVRTVVAGHDMGPPTQNDPPADGIVLFTSGTTGSPKPVVHTWHAIASTVRNDESVQYRRWLLAYHPATFAGMQVMLQAVLTGGTIVVAERQQAMLGDQVVRDRVEMASATPTFWRHLLLATARQQLSAAPLRQITLGGEAADQPLLDALAETFPASRITHIYASTEMGVCFSVNDGLAGFPADWLENRSTPVRLRVSESGELEINSPRRMLRYLSREVGTENNEWFRTGDLVEVQGDRVQFAGRRSDTINVGGAKVMPLRVEKVIRAVAGVSDARVFAVESSLAGQLVSAEVQLEPWQDKPSARREILSACRRELPKHMLPATIDFRSSLTTHQGKAVRGA